MTRLGLLALLVAACFAQYPLTVTPYQLIDGRNGAAKACASCYIYTYLAGTTTPQATYTTSALSVSMPNPVRTNTQGYAISGSNAITGIWTSGTACYHIVMKDSNAVTIWDQDHLCNPSKDAAAVNTLLLAYEALIASSTGSNHVGFIQSGTGAVAQTVQTKLRQQVDLRDFGAACDGSTDDTAAVQLAFNNLSSPRILNVSGLCVISSNVYLPYTAVGSILTGGNAGTPGGFLAKAASTPFIMLSVYNTNAVIRDLTLNGNNVATIGLRIVNSNGGAAKVSNVTFYHMTSDGYQVHPFGGPTTTITSTISSGGGAKTFTVAATSLAGQTIGQVGCTSLMIAYGTSTNEILTGASITGTLQVTATSPGVHTNTSGATLNCSGNNDGLVLEGNTSVNNGGWGLNMFAGTDNNNVIIDNCDYFGNTLGGHILTGSVGHRGSCHFENNGGPAEQLGDIDGLSGSNGTGRETIGWVLEPALDMEGNGTNKTVVVCDVKSVLDSIEPDSLSRIEYNAGPFCPAAPAGVTTLGSGYRAAGGSGAAQQFFSSAAGDAIIQPDIGMTFHDSTGTQVATPAFTSTGISTGLLTQYGTPNIAHETGASANNALVVTLLDRDGNPVPVTDDGTTVTSFWIYKLSHSLQAGANTIAINNASPCTVASPCNIRESSSPGTNLTTPYGTGGEIFLIYNSSGPTIDVMSR